MLKKLFKSKTINFNVWSGAIVAISQALGYPIPSEIAIAFLTAGNFFLRLLTKEKISDK